MNNNLQQEFESLIWLCKQATLEWSGSSLAGKISITSEVKSVLERLDETSNFVAIRVEREVGLPNLIDQLLIDEFVGLRLDIQRGLGYFFGSDLEDLLTAANGKYCRVLPDLVYLQKENWKSWREDERQQSIHAYIEIVKFIHYLKGSVADYVKNDSLIFLGVSEKLELPLAFSASIIKKDPGSVLDSLAAIKKLLKPEYRAEDRERHLKLALVDSLSRIDVAERFNHFISHIDQITDKFLYNFELFISNFSFEDDVEKLQADSRTFTNQLNSAIYSIQSRVIGIPFGTVVPALMLRAKSNGLVELKLPIFLASCFISFFILVILITQFLDLIRVKREYQAKWKRMENEIPTLARNLRGSYRSLECHFYINAALLVAIFVVLILFFTLPFGSYTGMDVTGWGGALISWLESAASGLFTVMF